MKIFMLWTAYQEYLSQFYRKYPELIDAPYQIQKDALFSDHCGWFLDLALWMNKRGMNVEYCVENAYSLQYAWAKENNCKNINNSLDIVVERIKRFKPDVLWVTLQYFGEFVSLVQPYCKKIIAWVGSPFVNEADVNGIAVLLTENPDTLKKLHHRFENVIVTKPAFEKGILSKIKKNGKKYSATFVGGIYPNHMKRTEILAYLIENGIDLDIFGIIEDRCFPQNISAEDKKKYLKWIEIIKTKYHKPVFGKEMYQVLADSKTTINIHHDVAGSNAGNMRLFEATGVGTCLITERSRNINELFAPDKEILAYSSQEELLQILKDINSRSDEIKKIGKAGQTRVLKDHSMERVFHDIAPALRSKTI